MILSSVVNQYRVRWTLANSGLIFSSAGLIARLSSDLVVNEGYAATAELPHGLPQLDIRTN